MADRGFILQHVPEPPDSTFWCDRLHWALVVMDRDDPDLAFVAGLLEQCLKRPGLTERQAKWASRIYDRLCVLHTRGALDRQIQQELAQSDLSTTICAGSA